MRSCCRSSKALTALMIVLMGCGVASGMVTYAVFRATSADPIPWKSNPLWVSPIDNFGPARNGKGKPPNLRSYIDATALLHARRRVLIYGAQWTLMPADGQPVEATRSL